MKKRIILMKQIEITQFQLQKPIQSIWVSAKLDKNQKSMIFLCNPDNQVIGFLFTGISMFVKEIYISDTICTMNGLKHEIGEGNYTLITIPLFNIIETKAKLSLQIETNITKSYDEKYLQDITDSSKISFDQIVEDAHRYYKGDFHGHTIYSDGHQSITEAAGVLKKQKMDFMAFTEHNTIPFGLKKMPCLLIPSFELTLPQGHMNIHGVKDIWKLFEKFLKLKGYEEILDVAIESFHKESNLSLNHMFMEPWDFTYDTLDMTKINTIEVICDPTYPTAAKANDKATAFLDFLWQEGITIYGIGGSDSHNKENEFYEGSLEPSIYGDPATYVFCKGLSIENILEGVHKGHCYISRYGSLAINICDNKYLPGDQVSVAEEIITYHIRLKGMCTPCLGRFIINGEIVKEITMNEEKLEASFTWNNTVKPWWLRFGLYDLQGHVISYVNPVYYKVNTCHNTTLKNLLDKFGEKYDQRHTI